MFRTLTLHRHFPITSDYITKMTFRALALRQTEGLPLDIRSDDEFVTIVSGGPNTTDCVVASKKILR